MRSILSALLLVASLSSATSLFSTNAFADAPAGQEQIIEAQESGRGLSFVEVKNVQVVQVLPDEVSANQHQKWMVKLANGRTLLCVYNIDITQRVPIQVGDTVSMGGQYIFTHAGGLIHWLHADPRAERPNGYVDLNGTRYGAVTGN